MTGELIVVEVCREYGMTYEQYCRQPEWWIEAATEKLIIDRMKGAQAA